MPSTKKRFIAGAVCPRCGAIDRLLIFQKEGDTFRECVNCDFHEKMVFQTPKAELDTRVNKTPEQIAAETRTVKLVDPDNQ